MSRFTLATAGFILLLLASFPVLSAELTVRVNESNGLPEASFGGKNVVSAHYRFFGIDGKNRWGKFSSDTHFEVLSKYNYQVSVDYTDLGFGIDNRISPLGETESQFKYDFERTSQAKQVIGIAIEFRLDSNFQRFLGKPEILPGRKGWIWGSESEEFLKFEFDSPVREVEFTDASSNTIRAVLFLSSSEQSNRAVTASFSYSDKVKQALTDSEKFGPEDIENWFRFDEPYFSPVDLSFLNHSPAGQYGFIQADGEQLRFADGGRARFWGTNISARALFKTSFVDIPKHARRLAELGFNLARLHHHDSYWVEPNVFGSKSRTTSELDDHYMKYIDKWIAELNKQGIYVWLDLHVQRYLTASDGITAFDEIERKTSNRAGKADLKGYAYVNPSIQAAMEDFNRKYLTRVNRFTRQKYADNPGIVALLLTNENDVTHHFGNRLLSKKNVPEHTALYQKEAREFSARWDLPYDKVWRSWELGLSKIFLNDLEYRFNQRLIRSLREYAPNHLIATTNSWGRNPLYSLPSLSSGDIVDAHSYGGVGALEKDPNVTDNFTHWIASAQLADKPVSVSEWNVEKFPVPDRHSSALLMGAMGAHQGWDAIMQFGYATGSPRSRGRASNYDMYNDPGLLGMMPAAALMYRMEHVQEASQSVVFAPTLEDLMYRKISPATSAALRSIPQQSKLQIALPKIKELPWLEATQIGIESTIIRDPDHAMLAPDATLSVSDTGELKHDWARGIYSVNSKKTQSVSGWIGGKVIELDQVEFRIETRSASVAVQSLDEQPIGLSENLLISVAARASPKTSKKAPVLAEPVTGLIRVRAAPGLKLLVKNRQKAYRELPVSYKDGVYTIRLTKDLQSYWFALRK